MKLILKTTKGKVQKLDIINPSLVKKETYNQGETVLEIIRNNPNGHLNQTRLSDVLKVLPYGIIQKEETGMGATHLELEAPRNSIIVEPIKVTASSKAHLASSPSSKRVLYVGSPTNFHPRKVYKNSIVSYISDPKLKYKKIIVVADSLYKVIDAIGPQVFQNYFLLLDEADSYQLDSTYRKSMDDCIASYKQFPERLRAMVSATINDFSDPELEEEHKTVIKYEKPLKRKITVLQTVPDEIVGVVYDKIVAQYKNHPNEKIVIAFNSVTYCLSLAEHLISTAGIKDNSLAILCGKNSEDKAGKFFRELQTDKLPAEINFITSAYFTGFDINESFHLISVSSINNQIYTLSDKRLKQIAGRCRTGLKSETIIHDSRLADPKRDFKLSVKYLVKVAKKELDALTCLKMHYQENIFLKQAFETVSEAVIKTLDQNRISYIRKDKKTGQFKISYLAIDARVETNKTRLNLYQDISKLKDLLISAGNNVKVKRVRSSTKINIAQPNSSSTRKEETIRIIEYLRSHPDITQLDVKLLTEKLSPHEKGLLTLYKSYCGNIDLDDLIDKIEEAADSKDSRALQNLSMAILFQVLDRGNILVRNVEHYFPDGHEFTSEQIHSRMKNVFTESNLPDKLRSSATSVQFLNLLKDTKRIPKKRTYKIIGENPRELKVLSRLPATKDKLEFSLKNMWVTVADILGD